MSPLYEVLKKALTNGEKLDQVHEGKGEDRFGVFYAMRESADGVRELVHAHWSDNGERVQITRLSNWAESLTSDLRQAAERAVGL